MKKLAAIATLAALLTACTTVGSDGALPEASETSTTTTAWVQAAPTTTTTAPPATTTSTTIPIVTNTPQPPASTTTTPDPVLIDPAAAQPVTTVTANGQPYLQINVPAGPATVTVNLSANVDDSKSYNWKWGINGSTPVTLASGNPVNWTHDFSILASQEQALYEVYVEVGNQSWGNDTVQVLLVHGS